MTASDGALADGTSGSAEPTNGGSSAAATVEVERAAPKINDGVSSQGPFHRADLEEPFLIRNTETIVCYRRVESTSRQNIATQLQIFPEVSLCEKHLEPRGKRALRNIAARPGEQQQLWSLITCCEPSLLKVAVQLPLPLATLAAPVRSASRGHYLYHRCLIDFCTQNSVRRAFTSFVGLRQTQPGSEQDVAAKTHCPDVVSVRATTGLCALPDCWCSSTRVRLRGAEHGSAVDSSVASLLLRKHRRPSLRTGGPVTQAPSRVANPLRQKRRGGDDMLHSPSNPLTAIKG